MESKSFKNSEGRKFNVDFTDEEKYIGKGIAGGSTYEVEAEFPGKFGVKKRRFVVKKYYNPEFDTALVELQNYKFAKGAGLKVFPTFRVSEDRKEAIMTSGFLDKDLVLLGDKVPANTLQYFGEPKIEDIKDFNKFLKEYFEQASIGARSSLLTPSDSPFFYVSRGSGPRSLDFVLGDVGNINQARSDKPEIEALRDNILSLEGCLHFFLERNLSPSSLDEYLTELNKYVQNLLDNLD